MLNCVCIKILRFRASVLLQGWCCQCCQFPDFSLRSQTFCYTADFSTNFYTCLKPRLFWISYHKTTSKHSRIQEFRLYFAGNFCDFRQKRDKHPHSAGSSCAWAGLQPAITCFQKFPDFLKTQCWQPWFGGTEQMSSNQTGTTQLCELSRQRQFTQSKSLNHVLSNADEVHIKHSFDEQATPKI